MVQHKAHAHCRSAATRTDATPHLAVVGELQLRLTVEDLDPVVDSEHGQSDVFVPMLLIGEMLDLL